MTKKLEELFDLPEGTNNDLHEPIVSGDRPELPKDTIKTLDKIDDALPRVQGLESSDTEMDDLAKAAKQSYEELMNLGMNVDSRFASEIFGVASNLLGHAITAKTAKVNKKLKMIDLQLKKMKLDQTEGKEGPIQEGEGMVLDRNEILNKLLADKDSKDSKA